MLNDSLIDKRTVERNIKKGRVDSDEYQRTLAALPDLGGRVWRHEERPVQAAPAQVAAAPVAAAPAAVAPAAAAPAVNEGFDDTWDDEDEERT